MKKEYILFIDSGIGGLSTLAFTQKILKANYIYFADNKNAPYGSHTKNEILKYLTKIISDVQNKYPLKMVVLACNTATTSAVKQLRNLFDIPIIGTEPAITLAKNNGYNHVFALTTETTKKQLKEKLKKHSTPIVKVHSSKTLAKNVENLKTNNTFENYLNVLKDVCNSIYHAQNHDVIVLGCTHYVLIREIFQKFTTKPLLEGNFGVVKQILSNFFKTTNQKAQNRDIVFIFSKPTKFAKQKYKKILGQILANLWNLC